MEISPVEIHVIKYVEPAIQELEEVGFDISIESISISVISKYGSLRSFIAELLESSIRIW